MSVLFAHLGTLLDGFLVTLVRNVPLLLVYFFRGNFLQTYAAVGVVFIVINYALSQVALRLGRPRRVRAATPLTEPDLAMRPEVAS